MISMVRSASAKLAQAGSGSATPATWSRKARAWNVNISALPPPTPGASIG
jgi:hypothetical protein